MADLAEFLLARIAEDEHFGTHDRHLAKRWDAECKAKRRIVERATLLYEWDEMGSSTRADGWEILAALALPYADHPDYREATIYREGWPL